MIDGLSIEDDDAVLQAQRENLEAEGCPEPKKDQPEKPCVCWKKLRQIDHIRAVNLNPVLVWSFWSCLN